MIGRPCKPDPDVNWLWRTLLPNTPLPACNSSNEVAATPATDGASQPCAKVQRSWLRKLWPERSQIQIDGVGQSQQLTAFHHRDAALFHRQRQFAMFERERFLA